MHNLKLTGFSAFEIIALMERRNQHYSVLNALFYIFLYAFYSIYILNAEVNFMLHQILLFTRLKTFEPIYLNNYILKTATKYHSAFKASFIIKLKLIMKNKLLHNL